jgi:hypothetical protein
MTTVITPPSEKVSPGEREHAQHPHWCDAGRGEGCAEHVSGQFLLRGDAPLVVEVFQDEDKDPAPLLSIMEYDRDGVITLPAGQANVLAAVLQHISAGIETAPPMPPQCAGTLLLWGAP